MSDGESRSSVHNSALWTGVEPHLDRALELASHSRERFLVELGRDRPQVARRVGALLTELAEADRAGFLLGRPLPHIAGLAMTATDSAAQAQELRAAASQDPDARSPVGLAPGATVGPYSLIREIGCGGMSSVWLAQCRGGQMRREVALKIPLLGPRMQLERFARERDILAALTHPNIARLYDAGTSDTGQPYLAMEYVAGTALTRNCDERCLPIRERLLLFAQVLQAVQFAHAGLIIHRDLKPSNILVTHQGRVVLLDFGIGKLLTDGSGNESHLTQIAGRVFTPTYASPEQIAGKSLGTASDIYSLGVILYELLTGALPYRPTHDTQAALEQAILNGDVRRPSQSGTSAAGGAARGASVRALTRTLAGDLDTIVLKALRKNPADRYASASAFAQDIANYLEHLPVSARPDSKWYRLARFTARHRIPVVAGSIAAFALLSGSALAGWQARVAATERDRAVALASRNEAVSAFLGRVITQAAESEKPVTVSEMLARSERLALADKSSTAENRAAVLEMIAQRYASLDDTTRAAQLLEDALRIISNSRDQALRSRLTCTHAAIVAAPGRSEAARRAIAHELEHFSSDPATASSCWYALARINAFDHHAAEVIDQAQLGLARAREAGNGSGEATAALLNMLGFGYHLSGRNIEADQVFGQALRQYAELGQERSDGALTLLNDWAISIGDAGAPRRALQLFQQAEQIELERESGAEPDTTTVGNEALALLWLGRFGQARATVERECRLARLRKDEISELHCVLTSALLTLETRSFEQTAQYLDRATQLAGTAPADSPLMLRRAAIQGSVDLAQGRLADARARFQQALTGKNASPTSLTARLGMAEVELAAGRAAAGVQLARTALQTATSLQGGLPYSCRTGLAWLTLGRAAQQLGDREQARHAFEAASAHLSNTVDADHPALVQAHRLTSAL